MLNRNTAAENAAKHLTELVPIEGPPVVEEHYLHEGVWQITLSYLPAGPRVNGVSHAREYKAFAIDGRSGEVLSMKIRNPKG
ncbi:MAG: hypothetical protein ACREH8_06505 [Opitutaceae bacterium]